MADEPGIGDVTPRKKKAGFGTCVIIGVVALIVVLGVTLFTGGDEDNGNANGTDPGTNTPITIPQLKSSIDSLTATVSGFSGRLATLETNVAGLTAPSVTQADIASLQAIINGLSDNLTDLEAAVANFTGTGTDGNGTAYIGEISRWDFDSLTILGCTDDYTFEVVSKSPSRIEEEDLYELIVEITNENVVVATGPDDPITLLPTITPADIALATIALNHELEIVISPRDYCMVDAGSTYLDSDSYPYLNWDTDLVTRTREGQEVCRRIAFTSEKYDFGDLLPGESLELDLVFELYYA